MTGPALVTRFAPSPTGYLHLGHAHSALTAWRRAREAGGRFLPPPRDIDRTPCPAEYAEAARAAPAPLRLPWGRPVGRPTAPFPRFRPRAARRGAPGVHLPRF